jgi:hypothetical protein
MVGYGEPYMRTGRTSSLPEVRGNTLIAVEDVVYFVKG